MESKIIEYALCRYDVFKLKIIALHKLNVDQIEIISEVVYYSHILLTKYNNVFSEHLLYPNTFSIFFFAIMMLRF